MSEPQHGRGNRFRFRTCEPHHADAAASGRGGDGNDGVVEVHRDILSGPSSITYRWAPMSMQSSPSSIATVRLFFAPCFRDVFSKVTGESIL